MRTKVEQNAYRMSKVHESVPKCRELTEEGKLCKAEFYASYDEHGASRGWYLLSDVIHVTAQPHGRLY